MNLLACESSVCVLLPMNLIGIIIFVYKSVSTEVMIRCLGTRSGL
jgi:hypothetical protein